MKTFNWNHISKMKNLDKPHPFPGVYPTRIAWQVGEITYIGKPSVGMIKWFGMLTQIRPGMLAGVFYEFDQDSIIRQQVTTMYGPQTKVNDELWKYYHPWQDRPSELVKGFIKRISYKDQIHRVYSPHEKLRTREHIEPFKLWLRKREVANGERAQNNQVL